MKSVLRLFDRLSPTRSRGFESKANTVGVCPVTVDAGTGQYNMRKHMSREDLQKNAGIEDISALFERMQLVISRLRMISKRHSQVLDF